MDVRHSRLTSQFVPMEVVTTDPSPTSKLVSIAVKPRDTDPEVGDFKTAAWIPGTTKAQVMVGPGTAVGELAPGVYKLWTKVTATPEIPVLESTNCLVIT